MGSYSQKDRHIAIKVDGFGNDSILLSEIKEGHEAVSSLFNYKLSLLSTQEIEPSAILGKPASIRLTLIDKGERFFNGVISSWRLGGACGPDQELFSYEAELSPRLWLASQCRNYRTFPDSNAKDVALKVLSEWKLDVDSKKLTVESQPVEMIVQYGESDFAFASRLLESLGVFYVFKHDASGKHVMTLFNANPEYVEGQSQNVPFKAHLESRGISSWASGERLGAGSVSVHAYNYRDSGSAFDVKAETKQKEGSGVKDSLSVNFSEQGWTAPSANSHFQDMVKAAAESAASSLRNSQFLWRGETVNRNLLPGEAFKLSGFPKAGSKDREVLVRETLIKTRAAAYYLDESLPKSEQDKIAKATFSCSLVCSDLAVKFQPSSLTPRPQALCPEHGVVLSGTSSIIQTDKWGRVKVKLNWGRDKEADQSFWCRVLQGRTGNGTGNVSLPEKGQEVVVSFLGGDLEAPVVTGCLYNSSNSHPLDLDGDSPKERHRSSMRHPTVAQDGSLAADGGYKEIAFWNMASAKPPKEAGSQAPGQVGDSNQPVLPALSQTYEGISITSDNNTVLVSNSNQTLLAGTGAVIDGQGNVTTQPSAGTGNIVISAGKSITLQVGRSAIRITDDGIDIRHQLVDGEKCSLLDSALTLEDMESELTGMQVWLTGIIQACLCGGIAMSSVETTLWDVSTSGASISNSATGILGDLIGGAVDLSDIVNTIVESTAPDGSQEDSNCQNADTALAMAYLTLGVGSALLNSTALLAMTSTDVSMNGFKHTIDTTKYKLSGTEQQEKNDPLAGWRGVLNDLGLGALVDSIDDFIPCTQANKGVFSAKFDVFTKTHNMIVQHKENKLLAEEMIAEANQTYADLSRMAALEYQRGGMTVMAYAELRKEFAAEQKQSISQANTIGDQTVTYGSSLSNVGVKNVDAGIQVNM